jgi:hypothetical protein
MQAVQHQRLREIVWRTSSLENIAACTPFFQVRRRFDGPTNVFLLASEERNAHDNRSNRNNR